jgi:hypothetical protein
MSDQVSQPYKTTGKIIVLCVLIFMLLEVFYIKGGSNGRTKKFVVFGRDVINERGGSVRHAAQFARVSTTIFRDVTLCCRVQCSLGFGRTVLPSSAWFQWAMKGQL